MTYNDIENKDVYLIKKGKIQEDLCYMFPKMNVRGHMEMDNFPKGGIPAGDRALLIICDNPATSKGIYKKLFETATEVCFAEELFVLLDFNMEDVVGSREVIFCADDDGKEKTVPSGVRIDRTIGLSDIKTLDPSTNFVVFDGYAHKIVPCLCEMGFHEEQDYIYLDYLKQLLLHKPSDLMKRTVYEKPQEQPDCFWPFFFAHIESDGEVHNCSCQDFVEFAIGNIKGQSPEKTWDSIYARLLRLSIINRTFCFCNDYCSTIDPKRVLAQDENARYSHNTMDSPSRINPCIDGSCNLYCESCRDSIYIAKDRDLYERSFFATRIMESSWLSRESDVMQLSGWGEVFFSKIYRKMLFGNNKKFKGIKILSNGNLFTPEKFDILYERYGNNMEISISIDAASAETYHVLRRGGNWGKLIHNLKYIGLERLENKVKFFEITMVVQRGNYKEIPDFVRLGTDLHADKITFFPMRHFNKQTSVDDYFYASMISKDNKFLDPELMEVFRDPVLSDKRCSFDWFKKRVEG